MQKPTIRWIATGQRRTLGPGMLFLALTTGLTACYKEEVGPMLDTPQPISNACLDLAEADPDATPSPQALLDVFDCLNSEGAFEALRPPLAYLVDTEVLAPYFYPGYLDTFNVQDYMQGGDLQLTVQNLDALLNDPDQPLRALEEVYVDFYQQGHLANLLMMGQGFSSYLYEGREDGPENTNLSKLIDLASVLYYSDDLAVLQETTAELASTPDPYTAEALQNDALTIARQVTSTRSTTGQNLLLTVGKNMVYDPILDDPTRDVDDEYAQNQWSMLQALQKPLCQLRSDRDTVDTLIAMTASTTVNGQTEYLPLYLRILANVNPSGDLKTDVMPTTDHDLDSFTIAEGDCNDDDSHAYPGAAEVDDRVDNDCDLVADKVPSSTDQDGDGVAPSQGDCDDTDKNTVPYARIHTSNGSLIIVNAAKEFPNDQPDFKDNDCDGFVDYIPSSMELLFRSAGSLLPLIYSDSGNADHDTMLTYGIETAATQTGTTAALDIEQLLIANQDLVDSIIYNYNNGTVPADLTALMRVNIAIVNVLADMGFLSTTSTDALKVLYDDHVAYETALANANTTEKQKFEQYHNACGENYDTYVDTLDVLTDLVKVADAYRAIDNPHLQALIQVVVNSDLLIDSSAIKSTPIGAYPPEAIDAILNLFDFLLAPPPDSGLYADNYAAANLWTLMGLSNEFFSHDEYLDDVDALMDYGLAGMDDPTSPLHDLPEALAALADVQTGGTVDTRGILELMLAPENRVILVNMLAIPADQDFVNILLGNWDALKPDLKAKYETPESTFEFTVRWIEEGMFDRFIDMAGTLLSWVVDNTGLGAPIVDEATPTPASSPAP